MAQVQGSILLLSVSAFPIKMFVVKRPFQPRLFVDGLRFLQGTSLYGCEAQTPL
jgi:hypothetical protein